MIQERGVHAKAEGAIRRFRKTGIPQNLPRSRGQNVRRVRADAWQNAVRAIHQNRCHRSKQHENHEGQSDNGMKSFFGIGCNQHLRRRRFSSRNRRCERIASGKRGGQLGDGGRPRCGIGLEAARDEAL
jgi:hypothetical protein